MPSEAQRARLPHAELLRLLAYEPGTGLFRRRVKTGGRYGADVGTIAGTRKKDRIQISLRSKLYRAHQLAWFYVTGEWPADEVDHIDGDPTNNRWGNLRVVSTSINSQNKRRAQSNNKTGLLGACWLTRDRRFAATIQVDRKHRVLGYFDTAEEAHAVYLAAKRELHVGCTI